MVAGQQRTQQWNKWLLASNEDNHGGGWSLAISGYSHGISCPWPAVETSMVVGGYWPTVETAVVVGSCWPEMETTMVLGSSRTTMDTAMELHGCLPAMGQQAMGFPRLPWDSQGVQMRRGAACQACPLQGDRRHSNQARGHKKLVLGMISTRISGIPTNPFAIGVLGKPWPVPTNGARLKPNAASKSPKSKPPKPSSPLPLIGKRRGYEVVGRGR